jgi:hypothetical protein
MPFALRAFSISWYEARPVIGARRVKKNTLVWSFSLSVQKSAFVQVIYFLLCARFHGAKQPLLTVTTN